MAAMPEMPANVRYFFLRRFAWLAGVAMLVFSLSASAGALRVKQILVAGASAMRTDQVRVAIAGLAAQGRLLQIGESLEAGTRLLIPAGVVLTLESENGAIITLLPGTDYSVQYVASAGEVHAVYSGAARFSLSRVFSFFNVDLHAYVARVWGTEFEVQSDAQGNVHVELIHGAVVCASEARARADDRWFPTEATDVLREDALRAVGYSADAGEYQRRFDSYAQALAHFAEHLREALAAGTPDRILSARNNLGQALLALGQVSEAAEQFSLGLTLALERGDLPWQARMLNNLAATQIVAGNHALARDYAQRALDINLTLYPSGIQRRIVHNYSNLGIALRRMGNEPEATTHLNKALAAALALQPDGMSAETAAIYETLGSMRVARGDADSAQGLALLERALSIRTALAQGRVQPDVAESFNSLGVAHRKLHDPVKALVYHQQALAQRQQLFGARAHPKVADSLVNVGNARFELQQYADALQSFQEALNIEQALASRGPRLADTYTRIAQTWRALGDGEKQSQFEALARQAAGEP